MTTIQLVDLENEGMKKNIHSSRQHSYSKCYDLEFPHSGFLHRKPPLWLHINVGSILLQSNRAPHLWDLPRAAYKQLKQQRCCCHCFQTRWCYNSPATITAI